MENKKIKLKVKDENTALQRIVQIFSRRGYYLTSMRVKSEGNLKEIFIEFPADYYIYKTIVGQLKKLVDLVEIKHDKIDYEHKEIIEMENIF